MSSGFENLVEAGVGADGDDSEGVEGGGGEGPVTELLLQKLKRGMEKVSRLR